MSPRSKEQNDEIREQRIHDIVLATIDVYADKGYLGTQMDDVASKACLAKGLLYYYFKSKQSLFQHVFQTMMDHAISTPNQIFDVNASIKHSLQLFITFFITAVYEEPKQVMAYWRMNEDLPKVFPERADASMQFFEKFHAPLADLFQLGMERGEIRPGDAGLSASVFWLGLSGVLLYLLRQTQPPKTKDAVMEQISAQLLHGIVLT